MYLIYLKFVNYIDFFYLLLFLIICFILSAILIALTLLFIKQDVYYEKVTSYECGFSPFEDARNIFDVKFYLIAILFLIFDIEIIFLVP
jgi:NADH-quinone oxidoreductase subunit A